MKKVWCIVMLACLLAGCGAEETFETVADDAVFTRTEPMEIRMALPEDAVLPVMETETGKLYICRDFEVSVQTLDGGDLDATIRSLCGFGRDDVAVVERAEQGMTRYDFVWTGAGETGDQVGRAVIYGDGVYHYCVSAMTDADKAEEYRQIWNGMFETVTLG